MIKKLTITAFLFIILMLTVGCVSVPLGEDRELKTNKDGVQHTDKEGKETDVKFYDFHKCFIYSDFNLFRFHSRYRMAYRTSTFTSWIYIGSIPYV